MLNSIKLRFIIWASIVFSVFATGLGLFLYQKQKVESINTIDRFLRVKSRTLSGLIEVYEDGKVYHELTEKEEDFRRGRTLYDIPNSGHYFTVFFEDGRLLAASPSLGNYTLPLSLKKLRLQGEYFETATGPRGEPLRVFTEKTIITSPHRETRHTFIIQTAEGLEEVYGFLHSLRSILLYGLPLTIGLFIIGGISILWLSLRPLREFSAEVSRISRQSLNKRLKGERVSSELKELTQTFNRTLDNIEKAFNIEKQFISHASHELKSPVSVIKSYCEIYTRRPREKEDYMEALDVIYENTKRMESIIEKLLLLSRLEEGKLPMRIGRLSLREVVDKALSLLRPTIETRDMVVKVVSDGEYYVNADGEYLAEAFVNIIDNAVKYSGNGKDIEITIRRDGNQVRVDIKDNGIGIPENEIEKIFQRFHRIEGKSSAQKGTGLGLSITKEIIEAHKGRIKVRSKVNVGSVFSVYMPLSQSDGV
jgi:signal transduction histidine kinase